MKRWRWLVPFAVAVVIGAALYLLALSTAYSRGYGQWYLWLLIANVGVGLALLAVIVFNLWHLIRALRRSRTGARLTRRLVVLFTALAVLPVGVLFYFSIQFINHSIDSWFDVNVAHALKDSLVLSRQVLAGQTATVRLRGLVASAQIDLLLANVHRHAVQPRFTACAERYAG